MFKSLLVIVLLPYARKKMVELYDRLSQLKEEGELDSMRGKQVIARCGEVRITLTDVLHYGFCSRGKNWGKRCMPLKDESSHPFGCRVL